MITAVCRNYEDDYFNGTSFASGPHVNTDYSIWVNCGGESTSNMTCAPAPWSDKYLAAGWEPYRVGWAQNQAADKPAPQPAPTDPNGKPTPPHQ
jgi:hypothetical protein